MEGPVSGEEKDGYGNYVRRKGAEDEWLHRMGLGFVVYRMYDAEDALLYVGKAATPGSGSGSTSGGSPGSRRSPASRRTNGTRPRTKPTPPRRPRYAASGPGTTSYGTGRVAMQKIIAMKMPHDSGCTNLIDVHGRGVITDYCNPQYVRSIRKQFGEGHEVIAVLLGPNGETVRGVYPVTGCEGARAVSDAPLRFDAPPPLPAGLAELRGTPRNQKHYVGRGLWDEVVAFYEQHRQQERPTRRGGAN